MYVPQTLRRCVLYWYHFYLDHPDESIIEIFLAKFFIGKALSLTQFKKRKTIYGRLPPKNISNLKLWYLVHVDLINPYSNSIRQHQLEGDIIKDNISLTCMKTINPATRWFEIVNIPTYNLNEVTSGNYEYIDK